MKLRAQITSELWAMIGHFVANQKGLANVDQYCRLLKKTDTSLVSPHWSGLWPIKRLVNVSFRFQASYICTKFFKLSATIQSPANFLLRCFGMRSAAHSFCYSVEILCSLNGRARRCFVSAKGVQLKERIRKSSNFDCEPGNIVSHKIRATLKACSNEANIVGPTLNTVE